MERDDSEAMDPETEPAQPVGFYYVPEGGGHAGPCTHAQLQVLWQSGHIGRETSLWREGMSSWCKLGELPELASLLTVAQPPTMTAPSWHYLDAAGKRRGGVSVEQMGMLLRSGDVDGLTQVWRPGMGAWAELGTVEELRRQLVSAEPAGDDDTDSVRAAMALAEHEAYDPNASETVAPHTAPKDTMARPVAAAGGGPSGAPSGGSSGTGHEGATSGEAGVSAGGEAGKAKKKKKNKPKFKEAGGSNVYVSGLPEGVDPSALSGEVAECFKVAGVLKADPATGLDRVKLYTTEAGLTKGDALIGFLKPESVPLAVTLRDGYEMRPGVLLRVQPARFEMRGEAVVGVTLSAKEAAAARKRQRLVAQRRLAEWDDSLVSAGGAAAHVVILLGLFSEAEAAEAGADFYANLKQDLMVECSKAGQVDKVSIFEGSERGAAAVKFKHPDDAQRCVAMMRERSFGSEALQCELYDGASDYRPRAVREAAAVAPGGRVGEESLEEQEAQLESFAQWLEADSTDDEAGVEGGD